MPGKEVQERSTVPFEIPAAPAAADMTVAQAQPVRPAPASRLLPSSQLGPQTKIYNRRNETIIIHDLVNSVTKEPLRLEPPVASIPHVVDVEDRYGAKAVRSSDGLRRALRDGMVAWVTPELEAQWASMQQEFLRNPVAAEQHKSTNEKLEDIVGKIPRRRRKGEQILDPNTGGIEDPAIIREVNQAVKAKNEYDDQLKELREEMKHDIVSG